MPTFHNRTRRSPSIPAKLVREGKLHLVPLYYLLMTSDLAREGIVNSGSYRFADHVYGAKPSGRFGVGYLVDAVLLRLKSARSMRTRYLHAKAEIRTLVRTKDGAGPIEILAVPCGLARELFEAAEELSQESNASRVRWNGFDLDDALIDELANRSRERETMRFWQGDALDPRSFRGEDRYDMIISTGFTEFIDDELAVAFFMQARRALTAGGKLFASGMTRHRISDYLLRNMAEIRTIYRSEDDMMDLSRRAGFGKASTYRDGLQTILLAVKE
jgi:hypothetical protein